MKRKITAVCMAAVLAAGSMGTFSVANAEGGDITNIVVETINYGFDDPDLQMVEDAINEITEAEIGVHVDFLTVPISEMATKLGLLVSGNEEIDLTCTGLLTSPTTLVSDGLLQPITEYINNSEILSSKAGSLLSACTVNGEIYAYPGNLYPADCQALIYDVALAEEYGIEMPESVASEEELTPIFQQVLDSGMPTYAISMGDGVNAEHWEGLGDSTYGSYGVVLDPMNGTEIVDWYETEEYEKQSRRHQEWFEAGYCVPDSISNGTITYDSMAQGQCFSFMATYGASTDESFFEGMTGRDCGVTKIGNALLTTRGVLNASWGIPSSSTKAEAVIKFVELLYSNPELDTLYNYGIEGTHYVKDGNVINYPEGMTAQTCGYGAFIPMFGDLAELPVKAPRTEEFYDLLEEMSADKADISKYLGYTFDPSNVSSQVTAVQAVAGQYAPSLSCGVVDVDTILPEFIDSLKAAGIDDIIAENQAQADAWLAEQ